MNLSFLVALSKVSGALTRCETTWGTAGSWWRFGSWDWPPSGEGWCGTGAGFVRWNRFGTGFFSSKKIDDFQRTPILLVYQIFWYNDFWIAKLSLQSKPIIGSVGCYRTFWLDLKYPNYQVPSGSQVLDSFDFQLHRLLKSRKISPWLERAPAIIAPCKTYAPARRLWNQTTALPDPQFLISTHRSYSCLCHHFHHFGVLEWHGMATWNDHPRCFLKAYRALLNVLALPLSPLGSEGGQLGRQRPSRVFSLTLPLEPWPTSMKSSSEKS